MTRLDESEQLEYIVSLQRQLQDYKYGVVKNGRLQGMKSAEEWNKYYRYMSPKEFERYHGGACWDYVAYQTEKLMKKGIKFSNYYLEFLDDPDHGTHTITVCVVGRNYVYIESSFKSIAGVYISDHLDHILDFVLTEMYKLKKCAFSKRHTIRRYKYMMHYRCDCETFMNWMYSNEVVREDSPTFKERSIGNRIIKKDTEPYYRVTYKGIGIYEAFKQLVPERVWIQFLKSKYATWLPKPPGYTEGYQSYFTSLGYLKFKQNTLPFMIRYLNKSDINTVKYQDVGKVVYRDLYQVVTDRHITLRRIPKFSMNEIKGIIQRIHRKSEMDKKEPTGNQNCMLCTWCLEAQFRGIDILPRPVYSPRDEIFKFDGYSIVTNPVRIEIRNLRNMIKLITDAGNRSRFYIHVNWNGSSGGHEFMIVNISNKLYVLDAQSGTIADIRSKDGLYYFNNINWNNSFIVRMDDREFNEDLLKYNDDSYILYWDDKKDREYLEYTSSIEYYFVSESSDIKSMVPRIPDNYMTRHRYEDSKTPRVCFAPSINSCLMALSQKCTGMELYVYIPDGNYEIYHPSVSQVPDVNITGEVWIKSKVRVKKIGKIKVIGDKGLDGHPYRYGNKTAELYDWDWKWIEKYSGFDNYFHEGYVMNEKDIYYNKDKFDSGEINLCFITGHSGSGKSTMGNNMQKDNVEHYDLDDVVANKMHFTMANLKEYGDLIYSFFSGPGKKYFYTPEDVKSGKVKEINGLYEKQLIDEFITYAKMHAASDKTKKFVIEGIWLYEFVEPSRLKNYAVYIKGTSALISTIRAASRDSKEEYPDKKDKVKRFKSWWSRFKVLFCGGIGSKSNGFSIERKIKKYRQYFSKLEKDKPVTESKKCDRNLRFMDISNPNAKKYLLQDSGCKKFINFYLKSNVGELIFDVDNDALVGTIFVRTDKGQEGFIHSLWINKDYRGCGLSHKLVKDAINKYHGCDLTVLKDNKIAINLYKKHGFVMDHSRDTKEMYYMILKSHLKK